MNKPVVDYDLAATPAGTPAPSAPATPAAAKPDSNGNRGAESKVDSRAKRRIEPVGVRIIERRAPDISRIVFRQVDDLRVRRFNVNDRLSAVVVCIDDLLIGGRQLAGLLRLEAHALHGAHHVALLAEEGVTQIGCPDDVLIQLLDHTGKRHQSLNAGVPGLLLRGLSDRGA